MHTSPKSRGLRGPSGFDAFLRITQRGTPFTAVGGRAFMRLPAQSFGGFRTLPIRSRAFRQWFFDQSFSVYDTVPTAHAFSAILHHLDAQAARDPDCCNIPVPYRIDSRGPSSAPEKILLDLANPNGQFVEITPQGWRVNSGEGFPFETSPATCSLPAPEQPPEQPNAPPTDSPLDTLRRILNLGAPDSPDWLRCLAWLLAALRPGGPFPILILRGPSGCGKSLAARILRTIVDPASSPFTPLPSSARELLTFARLNWVLAFDHVSTLTPQIAAALCRLATGVGVALREPGQREPLQLFIKRPILLTVTDTWTPPPDLAARALIVTLPPLAEDARRPEPEIGGIFQQAFPRILGALCTAVSHALACQPLPQPSHSRHAAALAWAQAAAPALNCTPREMLEAFDTPPPSDPFVDAVRAFLDRTPRWTGAAAELLKLLPLCRNPQKLSLKLRDSILPLADAGIDVQFRRLPGGAKVIDLFATQNLPPSPQPEAQQELIPTPEIPPTPASCVTPPPSLAPQLGKLRAGCLPAPPTELATRSIPLEAPREPRSLSPETSSAPARRLPSSAVSALLKPLTFSTPPGTRRPPISAMRSPRLSPRLRVSASKPLSPVSNTIESAPLIDTVPDILARIVAGGRSPTSPSCSVAFQTATPASLPAFFEECWYEYRHGRRDARSTVQSRDRGVLGLVRLVAFFQIHVRVVRGVSAGGQHREGEPQPADRVSVPGAVAGDRCRRRADHPVGGRHTKHQLQRPGQQVEVALAAHLAPEHKHCYQSNQKLRRIREPEYGH